MSSERVGILIESFPSVQVRRLAELGLAEFPVVDERRRRVLDKVQEVGVGGLEVLHEGQELAERGVGEREVVALPWRPRRCQRLEQATRTVDAELGLADDKGLVSG